MGGVKAALGLLAIMGPVAVGLSSILPLFVIAKAFDSIGVKFHRPDIGEAALNVKNLLISPIDFLIMKRARLGEVITEDEEENIISIALGVVKKNGHPLEHALELEAAKRSIDPINFGNVYFEPGRGLVGMGDERTLLFGNPALLAQFGIGYRANNAAAQEIEAKGNLALWVAEAKPEKRFLGIIEFFPVVRTNLEEALENLKKAEISTQLLSPIPDAPYLRKLSNYYFNEAIQAETSADLSIIVQNMQLRGEGVCVAAASPLDLPGMQVADLSIGYKDGPDILRSYNSATLPIADPLLASKVLLACKKLGKISKLNAKFSSIISGVGMGLVAFGLGSPVLAAIISFGGLGTVLFNSLQLYLEK